MNAMHGLMNEQSILGAFAPASAGSRGRAERASVSTKIRLATRWFGLTKAALLSACACLQSMQTSAQAGDATAYSFTTFAGRPCVGVNDGIGSAAQFRNAHTTAVDQAGNVYVADTCTIRKITPAGVVSTIAGFAGSPGSADGTNSAARFISPSGIAVDSTGHLYVIDDEAIRMVTPVGENWVVSTIAGSPNSPIFVERDGIGTNALFSTPERLAVDSATNIYVTDQWSSTVRRIAPMGTNWVVTTIAGLANTFGSADGPGSDARFEHPYGVTLDNADNLYVTDTWADTVRKLTRNATNWVVSTLTGVYIPSGPSAISADSQNNLYLGVSTVPSPIFKLTPVGTNWVLNVLAGGYGYVTADGTGTNAGFFDPQDFAADGAGNIYVADTYCIRTVTSAGVVTTLAGVGSNVGSSDGTGREAQFSRPWGVAVDNTCRIYVADSGNHTIRKITAAGVVSTIAGLAGTNGSADGVGNNARFDGPLGVATDNLGNVYVADSGNLTVRKITPSGVVSTLAGLAGSRGTNDGPGNNARFSWPRGVAVDSTGNVYVADSGSGTVSYTIRKITPLGTNWVASTIACIGGNSGLPDGVGANAPSGSVSCIALDAAGNLYVGDSFEGYKGNPTFNGVRKISAAGTNWLVSTIAGALAGSTDGTGTNAQFGTLGAITVDTAGNLYVAVSGNSTIREITPVGSNWVVTTIGGGQSGSADGAGGMAQFAWPSGIAVDSAGTLYVADSDNNTIRKGVFTAYTAANRVPYTAPPMNGQLVVTLLAADEQSLPTYGLWRFPWDLAWRNSGQVVSNLVMGNYPIEFRNVPGYLAYPPTVTATVTNGVTTQATNQYYPTLNLLGATNTGAVTLNIGPSAPIGAGWRFLGETTWRAPGSTASNLLPDTYAIEFAPVSGFSKPASQAVQVCGGSSITVSAGYRLAQPPPVGVDLPAPVPTSSINNLTDYPFGFNGQLQSDVGYGSGVAVQTNVVLTAAHLVFNDQTLSYMSAAYWYFQQEAGVFSPEPLAARGWYVLSGYATQRTNDLLGGLVPDQSSPQSRNLDVAALYFPSPVAGGGYGGYLPSDTVPNSWLTSTSLKMLVGYPVDGSLLGDASIVPAVMYQTGPQPYPLSLATDPVANQQVYTAPWFLSYPGNSGGPLYVQFNGYYYPAGVYLGTLYNGIVPYASLVRGIDSNVVNLITRAQMLGDAGTNGTGGGVITITAGAGSGLLAYLQVPIGPMNAVAAGAAWRVSGTTGWSTGATFTAPLTSGQVVTLEFKPIPGWNLPTNSTVPIALGQLTVVPATYTRVVTPVPPVLTFNPASGLGITGTTGATFRLEYRTSLVSGAWLPLRTNTLGPGFNLLLPWPPTNGPAAFYRAVWLP
jgi:hypothetical protein